MKYINTKTGYELVTDCECFGDDWELVNEQAPEVVEEVEPTEEVEEEKEEKPAKGGKENGKE